MSLSAAAPVRPKPRPARKRSPFGKAMLSECPAAIAMVARGVSVPTVGAVILS